MTLLNSDPNFTAKYGDASQFDFRPPQMVAFWSFRFMIGLGMVAFLLAAWGLWATRGGKASSNKLLSLLALINLPLPFLAAPSAGSSQRWVASRGLSFRTWMPCPWVPTSDRSTC